MIYPFDWRAFCKAVKGAETKKAMLGKDFHQRFTWLRLAHKRFTH
jgi:hypothetical protein